MRFLAKHVISLFTKNISQGAATTLLACLVPEEALNGQYLCDCQSKPPSRLATEAAAELLWSVSEELVSEWCADGDGAAAAAGGAHRTEAGGVAEAKL